MKYLFHRNVSTFSLRSSNDLSVQRVNQTTFGLRSIRYEGAVKATFHLTISMRGQRATGKIQRNNYHHRSCGASLTGKTMSVFLIFTQGTHRNVKDR